MSITYERMAGLKVDQDDGWFKSYQVSIEDCYLTNLIFSVGFFRG